ncbi:ribonuclease HII [Candidatus Woesearchaeota archaeon]|nr:ribonuclease HII [Candidatus Woesearchaeota archaeon]
MVLVCGIDEAGRGCIIGPLVMVGVLTDGDGAVELKRVGAKDSKLLSPGRREALFSKIKGIVKDCRVVVIPPSEIDSAVNSKSINLNWLEALKAADIINLLKPDTVVVDCPSPNVKAYRQYLMKLVEDKKTEAVVEHKADVNHVECSAASILAKVVRDAEIESIKKRVGDFGSGYLSDAKTVRFLEENFERFPDIFRKSWAPYVKRLGMKFQRRLEGF